MREEGFVSLWIGLASTSAEFDEYIRPDYAEDGELRPSQFMLDFALPRCDENCREAECYNKATRSVREMLSGFSYDDQLIPQFENQIGLMFSEPANAVVLLYNFNHQATKQTKSEGKISLEFVGVVTYHH